MISRFSSLSFLHRFSSDQKTRPPAPLQLSPYDILKTAAILLMLVDHIGAYLLPMDDWLRVIGRLCVPIWLFLIGYARSRRVDAPLILSAIVVSIMQFIATHEFKGLNILWTIIFLRLTLNPLMGWVGKHETRLYLVSFALLPLALVTRSVTEYGTMAWILGIWGYLVRNGFTDNNNNPRPDITMLYGVTALALFTIIESIAFGFTAPQTIVLAIGLIPVYFGLTLFLPQHIMSGGAMPAPIRRFTAFLARHTLGFYVLHLGVLLGLYAILCHCDTACCCLPLGIDPSSLLR